MNKLKEIFREVDSIWDTLNSNPMLPETERVRLRKRSSKLTAIAYKILHP